MDSTKFPADTFGRTMRRCVSGTDVHAVECSISSTTEVPHNAVWYCNLSGSLTWIDTCVFWGFFWSKLSLLHVNRLIKLNMK